MSYTKFSKKQNKYIAEYKEIIAKNHSKAIYEWFCLCLSKWLDELPKDDFGIDTAIESAEIDTQLKFKIDYLLF